MKSKIISAIIVTMLFSISFFITYIVIDLLDDVIDEQPKELVNFKDDNIDFIIRSNRYKLGQLTFSKNFFLYSQMVDKNVYLSGNGYIDDNLLNRRYIIDPVEKVIKDSNLKESLLSIKLPKCKRYRSILEKSKPYMSITIDSQKDDKSITIDFIDRYGKTIIIHQTLENIVSISTNNIHRGLDRFICNEDNELFIEHIKNYIRKMLNNG